MKKKGKLTRAERFEIAILLGKRYSYRNIGVAMGRSPNTVSYEVRENSVSRVYDPSKADKKARVKKRMAKFRWRKVNENDTLRSYIIGKLRLHWNPDEISGRMKEDGEPFFASKTAIYEWLYSARGQRYCRYPYSERYRKKRRMKKTRREMIPDRVSIEKRPVEAILRMESGHFEGDTVVSKKGGRGGVSMLSERRSRLLSARKIRSMSPEENRGKLLTMMRSLLVRSITSDNGIENKKHALLGVDTYFCDPCSSWQKGGVENGNKMLRRYFPKGTDFSDISQEQIDKAVKLINGKPRKILGYKTALEVAMENGILLKREDLLSGRVS